MLAQRAAAVLQILDAAVVAFEPRVAAAAVDSPDHAGAVRHSAGVEGFRHVVVERRGILGRQRGGVRRLDGVSRCRIPDDDLVERCPLRRRRVANLVAFQQRVALQLLLDEGVDLDIGVLQQLDRLTQLRRHDQGLALAQVETGGDRHGQQLSV